MAAPSIIADLASAAPNLISNAASGVANSGTYGAENTATIPLAPTATGEAETTATNAIPTAINEAASGLTAAANTEKKLVGQTAPEVVSGGISTVRQGVEQQQNAIDEYNNAVQDTHSKALDTEQALTDASQKATINPQQYLQNMGVGPKTLTAIGLALSGIGSGLTGQPNQAMGVVQANINRDIQTQQQIFQNKMEAVATQRGLLQSAQDRQNLSQLALNQATVMVTQGANVALNGLQAQAAGAVSPDVVKQMLLQNQLKGAEALSNINTKYVQLIKSGNTKNVNQVGLALDVAQQQLSEDPTGINKNPYGTATSAAQGNAVLAQPTQSQDPVTQVFQQENAKRAKTSPREDFLDQMAKVGSK